MGFYKTPEEMYNARANRFKKDGDIHWAKAKNGEGDYHFGKAKDCYKQVEENRKKALDAKKNHATFKKSNSR